jgi:hypothetical protein
MKSKKMNIVLCVLQILLAYWHLWGGIFIINNYKIIASVWALSVFPMPFWIAFGVLELLFALGLILPGMWGMPKVTAISAVGLAILSLASIMLYALYSGIGSLWGILPAIPAVFIAYKRWR